MDKRDPELDEMLESLRGEQPTAKEMRRWQGAVMSRVRRWWPAVAAGIAAGFGGLMLGTIGGFSFARMGDPAPCVNKYSQMVAVENSTDDATFELTYVKLD